MPTWDSYLVREEDGTSRFILEDSSGFVLLEQARDSEAELGLVSCDTLTLATNACDTLTLDAATDDSLSLTTA